MYNINRFSKSFSLGIQGLLGTEMQGGKGQSLYYT